MGKHNNFGILPVNIAIIAIFTVLFPYSAYGTDFDSPQAQDKAELQEKLNVVKTIEVTDALDLTEEVEAEFVELYAELEQVRWDNHLRQMIMLQELRKELADGNDIGVTGILDEIERDGAETSFKEIKYRTRIRCLIGDEEYAKLMLFETNFNRKVRDLIMKRTGSDGSTDISK